VDRFAALADGIWDQVLGHCDSDDLTTADWVAKDATIGVTIDVPMLAYG